MARRASRFSAPLLLGTLLATCALPGLVAAGAPQDASEAAARASALERLQQANEGLDTLREQRSGQTTEPAPASRESALEKLRQANESLEQLRSGRSAPPSADPQPPEQSAGLPPTQPPAQPADQGIDLPPAEIPVTGDTFTLQAPRILNDVITDLRGVFVTRRQCHDIDGIDTTTMTSQGPFDTNAAGAIISGFHIEQWDITACGQTTRLVISFEFLSDGSVRYEMRGDI